MYDLDLSVIPFILVAAVSAGFAIAFPIISSAIEERILALEKRTSELVDETYQQAEKIETLTNELDEKNAKLTDIRAKLAKIVESVDEDYSDMPELVKL